MPGKTCYVRATELIGFEQLVECGEINAVSLLREAGIDPVALKRPDSLISARGFNLLHEVCAARLSRPNFGLEWTLATPDHFPNLGPLMLLARLTSNLREFADATLNYWNYHTNAYRIQLLHDGENGAGSFRYSDVSSAPSSRHLTEHWLANVVTVCRNVTSRHDENPMTVRFQHPRPQDISLHEKIFRCRLQFDASHTEIVFDPKTLDFETRGGFTVLKSVVGLYIRHRIHHLPIYDQTMTTTVSLAIPSMMGTGNCNVEFVSSSIGLSSKKLRRFLAAEGTTFSDILDGVRCNMAREYLRTSEAPVAHIAGLLDYSSTPPFTLAFKRWTGLSPLEFRKQARVDV